MGHIEGCCSVTVMILIYRNPTDTCAGSSLLCRVYVSPAVAGARKEVAGGAGDFFGVCRKKDFGVGEKNVFFTTFSALHIYKCIFI